MTQILINDLLQISYSDIPHTRIKLNVFNGSIDPLDEYIENPSLINEDWFLWHNHDGRRYFQTGQIAICLLSLHNDRWLLTSIKQIDEELDVSDDVGYKATEIDKYKKFFGKVIFTYHNSDRRIGRTYESLKDKLVVSEVLAEAYGGDEFPGYENVRISYAQLKKVIDNKIPGWINCLTNQKAVYLITDKKTGKQYVGSATSKEAMLLDRWSSYVSNGHGGNKRLKELVNDKGFDYVKKNFQYSILENYNARTDDNYVLRREQWWKEVLCSREFGYNDN